MLSSSLLQPFWCTGSDILQHFLYYLKSEMFMSSKSGVMVNFFFVLLHYWIIPEFSSLNHLLYTFTYHFRGLRTQKWLSCVVLVPSFMRLQSSWSCIIWSLTEIEGSVLGSSHGSQRVSTLHWHLAGGFSVSLHAWYPHKIWVDWETEGKGWRERGNWDRTRSISRCNLGWDILSLLPYLGTHKPTLVECGGDETKV